MKQNHGGYRVAGRLALVAASIVVTLGAMEFGVRFVLAHYLNPFEPDATVGYRLKANFSGRYPWVPVRTDDHGFRVPTAQPPASKGTILFVGDSVTFGFGILADDSYPTLFAKRIGRAGDVMNAAVPGYNLGQVIGTIQRFVQEHGKPELVVYGLCLNDISAAEHPSSYEDIDPHAIRSRQGGLLSSSMLLSVLSRRLQKLSTPAASGPPDNKESLLKDFSPSEIRTQLAGFDREWSDLERVQQTTGVPIAVVVLPFRQQIEQHPDWRAPQEYMRQKCAATQLRCLDPWEMLREHRTEELYTATSSMHFSPGGSRLLADWLAESLRDTLNTPLARRPAR